MRGGLRSALTVRAVATIALGLAALWLTVGVTVAGVLPKAMSGRTLGWFPFDARAGAASAVTMVATGDPDSFAAARALAERALLRDATSVDAVSALGLTALASADSRRASRLFRYSYSLSRRDFGTLVWRIQERIQANDVDGALLYFDVAMRTSAKAPPVLLPILARAVRDPYIEQRLELLLRRNPFWTTAFFEPLVQAGEPRALFNLTHGRLSLEREADQFIVRAGVSRFMREGQLDLAWSFYESVAKPPSSALRVRNPGFEAPPIVPPMDWSLAEDPGLSGLRQDRTNANDPALFLYSEDERSGEVARQLLKLPAQRFVFAADTGHMRPQAGASSVRLECTQGHAIARYPLASPRTKFSFGVPEGCPYQWLIIDAGARGADDAVPWIDNVRIAALD